MVTSIAFRDEIFDVSIATHSIPRKFFCSKDIISPHISRPLSQNLVDIWTSNC